MFDRLRALVLRLLRVPHAPAPPRGAREVRVFRASPRFYRYRLLRWALKQASTVAGLAAGFLALRYVPESLAGGVPARIAAGIELAAASGFLFQLVLSYAAVRLDFELRWYIVTDRSLRIREGLTRVREQTMTFANIQNISVRQGPLQRLLGIADVEVHSAGGGGPAKHDGGKQHDMHVGLFRGVDNAQAIRAAVLDRIRRHRDAGLGDPDDAATAAHAALEAAAAPAPAAHGGVAAGAPGRAGPAAGAPAGAPDLLAAARELASEARALRAALARAAG